MRFLWSSLLLCCAWFVDAAAQPINAFICETTQVLTCPCDTGIPLPDGTPAYLYHDANNNGVDPTDVVVLTVAWCGEDPEFCCFMYSENTQPPGIYRYYIRVAGPQCCWTSGMFFLTNGTQDIELDGWTCQSQPCDLLSPPDPPSSVETSPCAGQIYVHWEHSGQDVNGFMIYRDGTLLGAVPADTRMAIFMCSPGVTEICVTAFNENGQSPAICDFVPPFLLRLVDGPGGDLAGDREPGSAFTLWFQSGGVDWDDPSMGAALILLSNNLPVDTLCGAVNVDHLTCTLPQTPHSNCRIQLYAQSLAYPGLTESDTTPSLFDIVEGAPPIPEWSALHFAYTLEQLGCPCSYPLQPPPGTMLRLKFRAHPTDPTRNPVIAAMPISAGSGLPPWNGYWTPRPDSILRMGDFYLEIQSDACCWIGQINDAITTDTMQVPFSGWSCGDACTVPPPAPSSPEAILRPLAPLRPPLNPPTALAISPNPFNSTTTISFVLVEQGTVRLALYDMLGREVATLADEEYAPGEHRLSFDGTNLATGLYFARLETGRDIQTRKLLLLK